MNPELIKRLETITNELHRSEECFRIMSNFVGCLSRDLYLINHSLEDESSTISRFIADSWQCQIDSQLHENQKLATIVAKLIQIATKNEDFDSIQKYVGKLAEVDASILDGYSQGKSNRPVDGLMPCLMPDSLAKDVTKAELNNLTSCQNWSDWNQRLTSHLEIVNQFVKLFPASHSFASTPCSISIILSQVNRVIEEQSKLENLLEILTSGQEQFDYSSVFGMDVLLIKMKLKPIPSLEEE